jgi:hypothetical protein
MTIKYKAFYKDEDRYVFDGEFDHLHEALLWLYETPFIKKILLLDYGSMELENITKDMIEKYGISNSGLA